MDLRRASVAEGSGKAVLSTKQKPYLRCGEMLVWEGKARWWEMYDAAEDFFDGEGLVVDDGWGVFGDG